MLDSVTSDYNVVFFQKIKQKNIYISSCCFFLLEIIKRMMIRTFVRYLTTKISMNPKPLAPNKPKASIDFVSKDDQCNDLYEIYHIG